jgi:flagellin
MSSLFSVNTNIGALAALQSLDQTQQAENEAQNEVSTGQKVSSAADNPAIYAIGTTINTNIAGLSAVSDSLNFGAQVVATASAAVTSISSVAQSLQASVTDAGTSGITLADLQQTITADLANVNAIASDATFSGINLLDPTGSAQLNVVQTINGTNPLTLQNQALAQNSSATVFTDALGLTNLSVLGVQNASASAANIGANISFDQATTLAATFIGAAANTNQEFQLTTTAANGDTTAYNFEFIDNGTTLSPELQSSTVNSTNAAGHTQYNKAIAVNFNSTTDSPSTIIADLATAIESQGFAVVTQSNGSLNVVGNNLTGIQYGAVAAGTFTPTATVTSATATTQTDTASGVSLDGLSTVAAATTTVTAAVTTLNTIAANLGSLTDKITNIQNFTSALSNALTAGVGALTDADLAEESAKLSSLQTKQSLATQSLSIANQAPQNLLTLFKNL